MKKKVSLASIVATLGPVLAGRCGVEVVFSDVSTAMTNGKKVFIPEKLKETGSEDEAAILRGFLAHEIVGHVKQSNFSLLAEFSKKNGAFGSSVLNVIEDGRIEAGAWKEFQGIKRIIHKTVEVLVSGSVLGGFFDQPKKDEEPAAVIVCSMLFHVRQHRLGQPLDDSLWVKACKDMIGEELTEQILALAMKGAHGRSGLEGTVDAVNAAQEILDLLKEAGQEQGQGQGQSDQGQSGQGQSGQGQSGQDQSDQGQSGQGQSGQGQSGQGQSGQGQSGQGQSGQGQSGQGQSGQGQSGQGQSGQGQSGQDQSDQGQSGQGQSGQGQSGQGQSGQGQSGQGQSGQDQSDQGQSGQGQSGQGQSGQGQSGQGQSGQDQSDQGQSGQGQSGQGQSGQGQSGQGQSGPDQSMIDNILKDKTERGDLSKAILTVLTDNMINKKDQSHFNRVITIDKVSTNPSRSKAELNRNFSVDIETRAAVSKVGARLEQILAARVNNRDVYGKEGRLCGRRLVSAVAGSENVFKKHGSDHEQPDVAMVVMIDCSGSMNNDNNMATARATGLVVSEAISRFSSQGVAIEVVGFDTKIVEIKNFEEPHPVRIKAFGSLKAGGGTRFQATLLEVVKKLAVRKESRKVVLFVTDDDLGVDPHIPIETLLECGIEVRGVLVGSTHEHGENLFSGAKVKHWGVAENSAKIPGAVMSAMERDLF